MPRKCAWLGAAPVAAVAAALAFTGSASAAGGNFTCRASAARVTALGLVDTEPAVANSADSPCASDSVSTANLAPLAPLVASGTATASTKSSGSSSGGVENLSLGLPAAVSGAPLDIGATAASSTASVSCKAGKPTLTGSSDVVGLSIAGQSVTTSQSVNLGGALGGVANVQLNQQTRSGTGLTQDAADITIAGGVLNGVHIVLGEAQVGSTGSPCSSSGGGGGTGTGTGTGGGSGHGGGGSGGGGGTGTGTGRGSGGGGSGGSGGGTGSGAGGSSGPCPAGSTLRSGTCVISGTKVTVPLTKSVQITGGTVMTLAAAKRKYGKHTACLNGAGPNWIVIGTTRANKITVGKTRMRVMGLGGNDHITVKGGNRTCVNGGAGNDVIVNKQSNYVTAFGANGNDKITLGNGPGFVLGGKGNDHIVAGKGKVNLQGNWGNDYIKAGNGPANLNGGAGNDTLVAGTGRAHLNGGPGRNRLTAHGKTAFVKANKGSKSVAYVRARNAKYARRHDVAAVHVIKK